jgi:hypothetical protein
MYVQRKNSEEIGHFVSSKTWPLSPSLQVANCMSRNIWAHVLRTKCSSDGDLSSRRLQMWKVFHVSYQLLDFFQERNMSKYLVPKANFKVHKLMKSNKMEEYADTYLLQNHSTCFRCPSHPSSGVHETVTAASARCHSIWVTTFLQRDLKVGGRLLPRYYDL